MSIRLALSYLVWRIAFLLSVDRFVCTRCQAGEHDRCISFNERFNGVCQCCSQ